MRGGWQGIDWLCTRGESNKKGLDMPCCVNVKVKEKDFIRDYIQNSV